MHKAIVKKLAARIPTWTLQRLSAEAIYAQNYQSVIASTTAFKSREELWTYANGLCELESIRYIEFGVFEGYSIKFFCELNQHPNSIFVGLDTFEGLPTNWGNVEAGTFDVHGKIPRINDGRTQFLKGLFWDSWPLLKVILQQQSSARSTVVHFDADLYSSTLFALSRVHDFCSEYIAIFDEFYGDEPRALYDYCAAFGSKVEFLAHVKTRGKSVGQVLTKISTANAREMTCQE